MFRLFAVLLLAIVATVSAAPKPSLLAYSTPLVAAAPAAAVYPRTYGHYAAPYVASPYVASPYVASSYVASPYVASPYVASPYVASPYFAPAASPYVAAAPYATAYTAPHFLRK